MITSQVAPGEWFPYFCNPMNSLQFQMRSKKAYEIYKKWVDVHQYKGLSYCLTYEDEPIEDFEKMLTRSIGIECKKVKVSFSKNSQKSKDLVEFKTIKINLRKFVRKIMLNSKE